MRALIRSKRNAGRCLYRERARAANPSTTTPYCLPIRKPDRVSRWIDHPSAVDRSPIRSVVFVVVVVVARTELERVKPIITRKRPLKVRRSLRTRHPKRARARFSASHDRTASDGGSSLRRRAKAACDGRRTDAARASSVVPFENPSIAKTNRLKLFARDFPSTRTRRRSHRRAPARERGFGCPREISRGRYGFPRPKRSGTDRSIESGRVFRSARRT